MKLVLYCSILLLLFSQHSLQEDVKIVQVSNTGEIKDLQRSRFRSDRLKFLSIHTLHQFSHFPNYVPLSQMLSLNVSIHFPVGAPPNGKENLKKAFEELNRFKSVSAYVSGNDVFVSGDYVAFHKTFAGTATSGIQMVKEGSRLRILGITILKFNEVNSIVEWKDYWVGKHFQAQILGEVTADRQFADEADIDAMSFTHELLRQFDRESVKDVIENLMSTRFFEEDVEFGFPISEPVVGLENAKKKFYEFCENATTVKLFLDTPVYYAHDELAFGITMHFVSKINKRNWYVSGIVNLKVKVKEIITKLKRTKQKRTITQFNVIFDKEKILKNLGATFQELQEEYNKWKQVELDVFYQRY